MLFATERTYLFEVAIWFSKGRDSMGKHAIIQKPIEGRILFVRGVKCLLDSDLAELYGVGQAA